MSAAASNRSHLSKKAAHSKDLDVAERCVKALAEIGRDDEAVDAVVEALERLADQDEIRCSVLAKHEAGQLKKTDEERAIEALEAAGARITRRGSGEPYSVMIMRDQDLVWLKMLPTLRSVSLMQNGVTDQGVKHLVRCDQIQSLTLSQTSITDVGLDQLRQMGSLATLSLSGNQFSARGIRGLAKIQGLRTLMWNSAMTDEQLDALGDLKQISMLYLSDVKPERGIRRSYQSTRPTHQFATFDSGPHRCPVQTPCGNSGQSDSFDNGIEKDHA